MLDVCNEEDDDGSTLGSNDLVVKVIFEEDMLRGSIYQDKKNDDGMTSCDYIIVLADCHGCGRCST